MEHSQIRPDIPTTANWLTTTSTDEKSDDDLLTYFFNVYVRFDTLEINSRCCIKDRTH